MLTPSRRAAAGEAVEEEVDGESWVGVCVAENAREGEKRACAPPPFSLSCSHTRNSPTNMLAARAAVARAWPAEARKLLTPPQGSVLAAEVSYLRAQWKELPALDAASAASAKAAGKAGGCGCGV